jgi:hypothetical protein
MFITIHTYIYASIQELLYIPTTENIKYKAKAWIDVFGCRLAKAVGSFLTHMAHGNIHKLRLLSEIPCLLISLFIILLAYEIGKDFEIFNKENIVIGNDIGILNYPIDDMRNGLIPGNENPGDKYPGDKYSDISNPGDIGYPALQTRNGLNPGDVGYDGYNLRLFEGVFNSNEVIDNEGVIDSKPIQEFYDR